MYFEYFGGKYYWCLRAVIITGIVGDNSYWYLQAEIHVKKHVMKHVIKHVLKRVLKHVLKHVLKPALYLCSETI